MTARLALLLVIILAGCAGAPAPTPTPVDYDLVPLSRLSCGDWVDHMTTRQRVDAAQIMLGIILARDGFDLDPSRDTAEWWDRQVENECARVDDPTRGVERLAELRWEQVKADYYATH